MTDNFYTFTLGMGLATIIYVLIDIFVEWRKNKKNEQREKQQNHEIKNIRDDIYDLTRQISNLHVVTNSLRGAYTDCLNQIEKIKAPATKTRKKK